jgi:hypothetical protein
MNKRNKTCEKVKSWLILNKDKNMPLWVKKHLEICQSCKEFARVEKSIFELSELNGKEEINVSPDVDFRVKKAIIDVSNELANKRRKTSANARLFPKVGALIAVFAIFISFLYLPLFNGENYFAFRFEKEFNNLLSGLNYSSLTLNEMQSTKEATDISGLKFMNAFFGSEPYKSFYYIYRDLPEKDLLAIRFFSELSGKNPELVYKAIKQDGYAGAIRFLGLSYKDTISKLNDFINKSPAINGEILSIEGIITFIDYIGGKIYLDSIYEPISINIDTINKVYVGEYVSIKTIRENNTLIVQSMDEGELLSTILKGTLKEIKDGVIILSNIDKPIKIKNGTIVKDMDEKVDLDTLLGKDIVIRAIINNSEFHALSIYAFSKGEERIISGEISKIYNFGFTLKNLNLSFCYLNDAILQNNLESISHLRIGNLVTVKGLNYGNKFYVSEIIPIHFASTSTSVSVSKPKSLFKASLTGVTSAAIKENELKTIYDYVLGFKKTGEIVLKSGMIIKTDPANNIPLGAKVKIIFDKNDNTLKSCNVSDYGKIKKISSELVSVKSLGNNIISLHTDQIDLFLYSEDLKTHNSQSFIQAKYIDYGDFGIAEKFRIFSYDELVNMRGSIIKVIEEGTSYLLDNGYILNIDELSSITGNSLCIGRTVDIKGVLNKGVIIGYIVEVSEDYGFISGTITEINLSLNYIKIDSGIIIKLTTEIVHSNNLKNLEIGDQVICKVKLVDGEYLASEIKLMKEYTERVG